MGAIKEKVAARWPDRLFRCYKYDNTFWNPEGWRKVLDVLGSNFPTFLPLGITLALGRPVRGEQQVTGFKSLPTCWAPVGSRATAPRYTERYGSPERWTATLHLAGSGAACLLSLKVPECLILSIKRRQLNLVAATARHLHTLAPFLSGKFFILRPYCIRKVQTGWNCDAV